MANVKKIVIAAWFTPLSDGAFGLPMLMQGKPGLGKSKQLAAWCKEAGIPVFHMLSPALHGEGAFGSVPVTEKHHSGATVLSYPAPAWAIDLMDDEARAVILVDEVTSADRGLQPPLMGLIQDRRIGFAQLGKRVRMIGACNPVDFAANGSDLPPPLANRFGHINFDTPFDDWASWMLGGATDDTCDAPIVAAVEEERVMDAWPDAWAWASGAYVNFIRARPQFDFKCPSADDPNAAKSWPSRRTNEFACRALASSKVHGLDEDDSIQFVASFVGDGVAIELFAWLAKQDLVNPADLLDGKVDFELDARRLDRTRAVLSACTALIVKPGSEKRDERALALWKLLAKVAEEAADVAYEPVEMLLKARLRSGPDAANTLRRLAPMMIAAGLLKEMN